VSPALNPMLGDTKIVVIKMQRGKHEPTTKKQDEPGDKLFSKW